MRIRIVDAFTDRPFTGNPAGVLLLDSFPADEWLQNVAKEVNLSETSFAHPLAAGGAADWALRWFTPTTEVDMCGHATLAAAHVLSSTGAASGIVRFAARCGILSATVQESGTITLDFPTSPLTSAMVPDGLPAALGTKVVAVLETGLHVGDLLVEVEDEKAVRELSPDFGALIAHARRGVIVTATAAHPGCGYDYVSRCFFPAVGIDEDPVTGSSHTALAPFWSARLGRAELTGLQASARSGLVRTTLHGERTLLTGTAVTVIDGELLVSA